MFFILYSNKKRNIYIFIILSFILCEFILIGQDFIGIWAGAGYEQAYFIVLLVMIPLTVPLMQNMGITILQAKNMHQFRSVIYIFIAILNVLVSIPLSKKLGGIGCALATGVSMIIGNIIIINIYYYKKVKIDIPRFWLEIMKLSIPAVLSLGITLVIKYFIVVNGLLNMVVTSIVFMTLFIPMLWGIGMNNNEKELFVEPIKIIKKRLGEWRHD